MSHGGDQLARGAKSAQFSAGGHQKSQLQWDLATLPKQEFLMKYLGTTEARYLEMIAENEQGRA